MKKSIITTITAVALTVIGANTVTASPFDFNLKDPKILVNQPLPENLELQACFGCISPSTGRFRDGYVRPHFRSNGSFVNGYWRS